MISYVVSFRESSYPPASTGKTEIIKTYFVEHASLSIVTPPKKGVPWSSSPTPFIHPYFVFDFSSLFHDGTRRACKSIIGRSPFHHFKINNAKSSIVQFARIRPHTRWEHKQSRTLNIKNTNDRSLNRWFILRRTRRYKIRISFNACGLFFFFYIAERHNIPTIYIYSCLRLFVNFKSFQTS